MNTVIEYVQISSTTLEKLIIKACLHIAKGFQPVGFIKSELELDVENSSIKMYSQKMRKTEQKTADS